MAKKVKSFNEKCEAYLNISERIKKLEKQLSELRSEFIASNGGESTDFLVSIRHSVRESVAAKTEFVAKFGPDFLKENGLLKVSEVKTVSVTDKSTVGIAQSA
jgi:hypothetical protein